MPSCSSPFAGLPPPKAPALPALGSFAFIASAGQAMDAARDVIHPAIDFLMAHFSLSPQHACIPCSVALDLRISQCVDTPMITVTGLLDRALFADQG